MTSCPGRTPLTDPSGSTGCVALAPDTRTSARSKSRDTVSTRPGNAAPDASRIVTEVLVPTTCRFVMTASAAAKNPLPRPSRVSIDTIAGMELLTTSSRAAGPASALEADDGDAVSDPPGAAHASAKLEGAGASSCGGSSDAVEAGAWRRCAAESASGIDAVLLRVGTT